MFAACPHAGINPLDFKPVLLVYQCLKAFAQGTASLNILLIQSGILIETPCPAKFTDLAVIRFNPCQAVKHPAYITDILLAGHCLQRFHVRTHLPEICQNPIQIALLYIILVLCLKCKVFCLQHINLIGN